MISTYLELLYICLLFQRAFFTLIIAMQLFYSTAMPAFPSETSNDTALLGDESQDITLVDDTFSESILKPTDSEIQLKNNNNNLEQSKTATSDFNMPDFSSDLVTRQDNNVPNDDGLICPEDDEFKSAADTSKFSHTKDIFKTVIKNLRFATNGRIFDKGIYMSKNTLELINSLTYIIHFPDFGKNLPNQKYTICLNEIILFNSFHGIFQILLYERFDV